MIDDNADLNTRIKILIKESDYLIDKNELTEEEFIKYRKEINEILIEIIQSDFRRDIKKNAYKALRPFQNRSKLDFFPFSLIYKILLYKAAWDHNMPFLVGKNHTDKFKSQIPKIKIQLEAIEFKMKNLKT